ncbi:protein fantom isoform X2 [Myripristis murdjan]|uniref:protein fantom isoform X2 n=1 Tax=Myripristis murdjan TaxID=586833 RepID=UPI00117621DE|nr:protein fantom isoform X2 [Myripristis murdjan]
MSTFHDETAADVPVRDITLNLSEVAAGAQDLLVGQNARPYQDISRVSREELEDRFLRLYDETLLLKQHIHKQDDKIKKLGTKLMRLVKDRGRMEQLAAGGGSAFPRVRDLEREELVEELQEKVRALQGENEGLKQRLLVAKQQVLQVQSRRTTPYGHVQPRINSGMKRLRDDTPSPSQLHPKSARSVEGGGRPPTGQLPRYGHSLLEDARAEIRNLHNVIESQQSQIEEMDQASELLRDQLRKKETEYEERLLEIRQQQTSKLRSNVSNNVTMIKLQKELTDRANAITILEGRFLQLQESHNTMKTSHDAAMVKVVELTGQLKDERLKSLNLERQLQNMTLCEKRTEELQDQINDLVKERDLLKENHDKLVSSAFDVSQQQKWRIQEQQLKLQIAQLEMALKADLTDKNEILDKIKAERDNSEKLAEEKKQLQIQVLEQKQQLDELNDRMKFYTKVCKSQKNGELGFLEQVEEETLRNTESSIRELRAAHAETIQELEKTRNMLSIEHKINKDYKVELEAVSRKMDCDKIEYEQRSERQAQLLDMRAAKIKKLEAQLRNLAYGTKTYVFKPDITDEDEADEFDETVHLERGENLLELQIVNATLPPSALEAFGDSEPATFCSYAFYDFEVHSTPVVTGHNPKYGFTSQYVVCMGDSFLEYLHSFSVTLELHLAMGLDYRTVAKGQLRLRQLLEQDGKVHGTVQLVGISDEIQSFGSVDYWMRLRIPMKETIRLYKERVKAMSYIDPTLNESGQLAPPSSSCNVLYVTVQCCRNLPSRDSQQPSPYVIYKFFDFPEHDTATVQDCCDPQFHDLQSYSVLMDMDLDRYLKSDALQFYVFDYKDEQMDTYLGKARVPLLSLAHDKGITGVFELANPSGLSTGHIEVTLKWKFTYMPPPGSTMDVEPAKFVPKEMPVKETDEHKQEPYDMKEETATHEELKNKDVNEILKEEREVTELHHSTAFPDVAVSNSPLPKPRLKTQMKERLAPKKVTFLDVTTTDDKNEDSSSPTASMPLQRQETKLSPIVKVVSEVTLTPPNTTEEEPEEDESHYSEGQVIPVSSQSCSDDSEISEEIIEKDVEVPAAEEDQSESTQSDSDDCIVPGQLSAGRKPSDRVRVEIVSLGLRPESRVAQDSSVVRLFVEYSLLDLPTEETPLSLPKPLPGKSIHYNYSNVIHVDVENNQARRELLKGVLQGHNPQMESIRFTVVSEPPEEEEQERECEDVGVAYLRIPDILEKQQDVIERSLNVVDVEDTSVVVGSLTVSVEGLEAMQAIMEDPDREYTPVSALQL